MDDNDPYHHDGSDDDFLYENTGGDDYQRAPDPDEYSTPGQSSSEHAPLPPYRSPFQRTGDPPSHVSVSCTRCGYNLTGVAIGGSCPECGARVDNSLYAAGLAPANGMAITSLVIGIISVTGLCCCPTGFLGILGMIFGGIAMNQMNEGTYNNTSRGMATAGMICSGAGLILALVWTLLVIA